MTTPFMEHRKAHIFAGRPLAKKQQKPIAKVSAKRKEKMKQQGALSEADDMNVFFDKQRPKMVGICQCGCAEPSQKDNDTFFKHCICHIFPKAIFESVRTHPLNWVERKFWASVHTSACHTNMDEQGMDKWPMMADWDDIKEKFHALAPLLTDEERATKFYTSLERLVYAN